MKWRFTFLLVLLAALGTGGYWLDDLLSRYGLAIHTTEREWVVVSYGWDTLYHLWPVALVGVLTGGIIAFVIVMYGYSVAKTLDERGEFFLMRRKVEVTEARAADAERRARANYWDKMKALEAREQATTEAQQAAAHAQQAADARHQHALEDIAQARAAVDRANAAAEDAEARRKRAFNGFRRLQKKLERLQGA